MAFGIFNTGSSVGAVIAPLLIAQIATSLGWRWVFFITGSVGFVWAWFWLRYYQPPARNRYLSPEERKLIPIPSHEADAAAGRPVVKISWFKLFTYREVIALMAAKFMTDAAWYFFIFWLPKYLVEQRGFTMVEMGMLAWIPYLSADLGALFGGWLSGRLVARGRSVLSSRFAVMLPCALLMPVSLAIHQAPSRALTIALICVVTFAHMAWKTNQNTLTNDLFPKHLIGATSGLLAFGTGLGGTLFIWMTGHVVQGYGYGAIFIIMGLLHPISYLITRRFVRQPIAV